MKKGIHPQFKIVTFTDISSGEQFKIGSTIQQDEVSVEISSASHPFFTGEERVIDTENRIDTFQKRQSAASDDKKKKKAKKAKRKSSKVQKVSASKELTLKDMMKNFGS